jgi:hypothetical protein
MERNKALDVAAMCVQFQFLLGIALQSAACRGKLLYFPMQKEEKIRFRMSSVVVAPVIWSSGRKAL